MSKEQIILFSRDEVEWLYRRVSSARNHAREIMQEASTSPPEGDVGKLALQEAQNHVQMLNEQTEELERLIRGGMMRLGSIQARKDELLDSLSLVEEPHMKQKIQDELDTMPKEEEYRVNMNRASIKYIVNIIENSIHRIKTQIIPAYEKRPAEHFETNEQPMSRTYYINKNWREKLMLEKILVRLEKRL